MTAACKRCNDQGYVVEEWTTTRLRPPSVTIKTQPAHWFTKGAKTCTCNKDEKK
jgi:hypothetical protein